MGRANVTQDPPASDPPVVEPQDPPASDPPASDPPADSRPSRRAQADAALARSATASKPLVLAQGCVWHEKVQDGIVLGKSGITVETSESGPVREYVTWVPRIGRVQKIPTYAAFDVVDAGDLE